jgi:hypothetical protein
LKVANPGIAIPLYPVVDDVGPDALRRLGEVHKHDFPSAVVDSPSKLFDEHLEAMDAHARPENQKHVRAEREVVLDKWADEVGMRVVFSVQDDVGAQFADAECSLASFLPGSGGSGAVRAGWLASGEGVCKTSILVP